MKNEKWMGLLTFASHLAVFAGLGLVAFEIHQAQAQMELLGSADGADNFTEAMAILSQDEELAQLMYTAELDYEALDDFQRWRVSKYLDGYFTMSEQDYLVLTRFTGGVQGFEFDWKNNMSLPAYREYWASSDARYSPEFRSFIDRLLEEGGP